MPTAPRDFAEPGAESFEDMTARVLRVRERMEQRAGEQRILLVTHYGWLHLLLGLTLFRDAFGPEHLLGLWLAATPTPGSASSSAAPAGWTGWTSPAGA